MDIKNVINQYYDMIHKIAYSKTQNVNDADDLTQEVFLKYLQSDKKFDSDDHIKNWLIRVTINTYLHQISSGWNKNILSQKSYLSLLINNLKITLKPMNKST